VSYPRTTTEIPKLAARIGARLDQFGQSGLIVFGEKRVSATSLRYKWTRSWSSSLPIRDRAAHQREVVESVDIGRDSNDVGTAQSERLKDLAAH
jgi:hypothetical protein